MADEPPEEEGVEEWKPWPLADVFTSWRRER